MKNLSRFLLLFLFIGATFAIHAQDKPRWAQKDVSSLEKERTNDTYRFVKFETFGGDLDQLRKERLDTLVQYFADTYALDREKATVTPISGDMQFRSVPNDENGDERVQSTYLITFNTPTPVKFYAELVDEYVSLDENVDMTFDYTLYQLYAVSTSTDGVEPKFDDFKLTRSYNAKALAMSIVPGWGQLYKGQETKAYCIMGAEVVFIGTAIVCDIKRSKHEKNKIKHPEFIDSYHSKAKSWRTMRNISIGCASIVYIYNLCDAAFSKGARQVLVSKPKGTSVALAPSVVYDPMTDIAPALSLSVTF